MEKEAYHLDCNTKKRTLLLFAIFLLLCVGTAFAAGNVSVVKYVVGQEAYPSNKTISTIINITNTGDENITNILVRETYDPSFMTYSTSSPTPYNVNFGSGIIDWNLTSVTEASQSTTISLSLNPKKQGITYNNVTANATFISSPKVVDDYSINFTIGDAYENDDIYTRAKTIPTDGTEQFHTFYNLTDGTQDQDWVKFTAQAGNYYIIQTRNYSHEDLTDTVLSLYDTDGTTKLQENDDIESGTIRTSKIVWRAYTTGVFYVKIVSWDTSAIGGNYSIAVEKQGKLSMYLDSPSNNTNITQYSGFNVAGRLECNGGPCRDVSFTLDPKKDEPNLFGKDEIEAELGKKGTVNVIVKLKDEQASGFGAAESKPRGEKYSIEAKQNSIKKSQEKFLSSAKKFNLKRKYSTVFNGVSGSVDEQGIQELLENENVEAVYYDYQVQSSLNASVPHIDADDVWLEQINGTNITGEGQTVCVIDTGINYTHPDFGSCTQPQFLAGTCSKVPGGYDFINTDNNPKDDNGHGSHCAGIVASEDSTYRGVAPGAKIIAIKSLASNGIGPASNIAYGIDWCVANMTKYNISVISMSLGDQTFGTNLPCDNDFMASSINSAVAAGITVVVASGNENRGSLPSYLPGISTPACVSNAISVGSIERSSDSLATYTNRDWFLDVLAPGGLSATKITATDYLGTHTGKYGTSMATPHVAGVIALMQQKNMEEYGRLATPQDIRNRLRLSNVQVTDGYTGYTFPRVDAYDAVMQKGVIPNITGALPFYTNGSNPVDCGDLADGGSCNVTWWVNATSTGAGWEFFLIGESDVEIDTSNSTYLNVKEQSICTIEFNPVSPSVYGTNLNVNCSCTNTEAGITLTRNSTDVTGENNVPAIIGAGNWVYNCSVPETASYTAGSTEESYTATRASTILSISALPAWLGNAYGTETNVSCSITNHNQASASLEMDGGSVSNPDNQTLGAGNYTYNCSASESQNYTSNYTIDILQVTRQQSSCALTINDSSMSYGAEVLAACECTNPEVSEKLYKNGTDVTSSENNTAVVLPAGSWQYVCNSSTTQNYTGNSNASSVYVSRANSIVNLTLDGVDGDNAVGQLSIVNITGILVAGQSTVQILENGTQIGSGESLVTVLKQYNNTGTYNLTAYYPATQNYSSSYESHVLIVLDTTPPLINITSPLNNSVSAKSHNIALDVETDETAACTYSTDIGENGSIGTGTSLSGTFSIYDNGAHSVTVNCTDGYSNSDKKTHAVTITDVTMPNITGKGPSGSSTDTTPTLTINTDEPAICYYTTAANETNTSNMTLFSNTNSTSSTSTLSLSTGSYTYYALCSDRLGNEMANSTAISFTITSPTSSGGGGGGGGCSDECKTGEIGCFDVFNLRQCQYSLSLGCWKWEKIPCQESYECMNGVCEEVRCIEEWICDEWMQCTNGTQQRDCEDWNACGTEDFKPRTSQECAVEAVEEEEPEPPKEVVVELTEAGINEIIRLANGGEKARKKVEKINKDIIKGRVSSKRVNVRLEKSTSVDSETGEEKKGSKVTLKVTAEKGNESVEIVHFIPKRMANTVDEIKFDVSPTEILEIDPVVRWEFVLESIGDVKEVSYFVEKEASIEQITTLAVAGDVKKPSIIGAYALSAWSYAIHYVKGYWKYATMAAGVIVVIIVLISSFRFKKMKTRVKDEEKPRGSIFRKVFHHKKKSLKEIGDELDDIGNEIKKI